MAEEHTKSSGGAAPAAHVLDAAKRQLVIAPQRASAPWAAGLRPLSPGAMRAVIAQVPGIEVVRILRTPRAAGRAGVIPEDAGETYVVRIPADRADLLAQTLPPQLMVEDDAALEYGTAAGLARPAPTSLASWSGGALVDSRPVRFRVVGEGDRPLAGVGVSLAGEGFPQEGRTDKRGEVTLPLLALPGRRARSVLAVAPSGYWDHYVGDPDLSEAEVNVVRLIAIDETMPGFPAEFRYGWGQLQVGLDRIPEIFTGQGLKIAVVDSGADSSHPLLRHVGTGVDLTNAGDARTWTHDLVGHGSHCAGILAARDDSGKMLRGFVPDAEIHVLKVFPGGRFSTLLEALDYCLAREVDIVNLSLGSPRRSRIVEQKLEELALRGIACIAAAGNTGGPAQYPASSPYVLAVGAIGRVNAYPDTAWDATTVVPELVSPDGIFSPSFSSFGPQVSVCAPGVAVVSTVPGGFEARSGTSTAAPHVAGIAALLLAHHPLFQESLRARTAQRVAALFGAIRGLCVPYAFGGERIGGIPRLHGLGQVLRPSLDTQRASAAGRSGNGREAAAALREQLAAAAFQASAAQAGAYPPSSLAAAVAGASDPWAGAPGYAPGALGLQEWPFHALLETFRQRFGGWS